MPQSQLIHVSNDTVPDSKVHEAILGRQDPCMPKVGPMNFAIWG